MTFRSQLIQNYKVVLDGSYVKMKIIIIIVIIIDKRLLASHLV